MKTHAEKIREAVTDLGEANPKQIMDWIKKHYPEDDVNPQSYRADIIGCSKNHTSQHHYPTMPKFLLFNEETKKYHLDPAEQNTLLDPEQDGRIIGFMNSIGLEPRVKPPDKIDDDPTCIDGIPVAKLSVTGQVDIPLKIREKMGLKAGDTIAFLVSEKGVEIRKARIKLDFS